ncbi:hypothetical protein [Desmospora profundinema]|uniref:ABC transporter permease n=1 Tax=Desmospora profundinema TaxID=1571184 RepID=A0ABU1ISY2_9BACL|nr:hypothetical protein [Desmospora profundinema]MDR6226885.1 hypothetical protein [Desmospora profundinema]
MNRTFVMIHTHLIKQMRSYSFLIVIGLTLFLGYAAVPAATSGYEVFTIGGVRGIYNSAWLGGMVAMFSSLLLWLFGFYMLRSKISEDQQRGVGPLIASTPISKFAYISSKVLSNFVILVVIQLVLIVAFIAMQWIRGEDMRLDWWGYLNPFLIVVLPSMAVLASVTVLFDVFPGLKGSFGNIFFFFMWIILGVVAIENPNGFLDVYGIDVIRSDMVQHAAAQYPSIDPQQQGGSFGYYPMEGAPLTFEWEGVAWTASLLLERSFWFLVALGLTVVSTLLFRRFSIGEAPKQGKVAALFAQVRPSVVEIEDKKHFDFTPIRRKTSGNFPRLVKAELLLMLKGINLWWYLVALGLIAFSLIAPLEISRNWLPLVLLWPLAIWSQMATRETLYRTEDFVLTSTSVFRPFFALWLSGVLVTLAMGSGVLVKGLLVQDLSLFAAWLVSTVFVPTLALMLGVWFRTRKMFEVIYLLWWYMGPVNGLSVLDFLSISGANQSMLYLTMTAAFLVVAVLGQKVRVQF